MHSATRNATLALTLLLAAAGSPAAAEGPFDACEASFAAAADDWNGCGCFHRLAARDDLWDEAGARLEGHLRDDPDDACLAFNLGRLHLELRRAAEAAPLLRRAADGYAAEGVAAGEVYALVNLAQALAGLGASGEELTPELDRARRVAEAARDPVLRAVVAVDEAKLLLVRGGDAGEIEASLREVRGQVFPEDHASLRRDVLLVLGGALFARGRFAEAEELFEEAVAVTEAASLGFSRAAALQNLAAAVAAQEPFAERRERVADLLLETIEAAVESGHVIAEVEARKQLARLLDGPERREQLAIARERIEPFRDRAPETLAGVLAASAVDLLADDPAEARRRVDEAAALLARAGDLWSQVHGWGDRLRVIWATGSREEALAAADGLLQLVDRLEEIQSTETARAEVSAVWTEIDQWLAGRLMLEAEETGDPDRLEEAFAVSERMRARLLLESLAAGGVGPADAASPEDRAEWLEIEHAIVALHRRFLDPSVSAERRAAILDELRALEAREDRMAARRRRFRRASIGEPEAALSLDEVRAGLAPDEAVLAFQVGPWEAIDGSFDGGSWLLTITAEDLRLRRLPDRSVIAPAVEIFLGTFERRDGSEEGPASGLWEMLLGSALDELPEGIERLVVIPDGPLHRLPFAALRRSTGTPPLVASHELFVAPSATVWRRLRETAAPGETTLALADPLLGALSAAEDDTERSWAAGLVLPALPHSRREGRSVLRHLGRPGRLLLGGEASEAAVKRAARGGVRLVHLGTHAVHDEAHPHRSAVMLSPGGADQDGYLRPREAAALDLAGAVVVLASCQSAQGTVLRGEGALSLSRAFLEGGARAVVGSLWPLVDDESAEVFDRFYRHLGRGETVAHALALAQRESLEAGDPAAAWAGLVVLGDGDAVVVPDPPPAAVSWLRALGPAGWALLALGALGMALAAGTALLVARR